MEDAKNVLGKLKNIIEEGKDQDKKNKLSLYELKVLINQYRNGVYNEKDVFLKSISKKLGDYIKIYIDKNKVIVSVNAIKRIDFEVMDDDIKVVYNDLKVKEPLSLIGRDVLNYYNLMYPVETLKYIDTNDIYVDFENNDRFNVNVKDTDLSFEIDYLYGSLNFYYNSLKVMEFIKDNYENILKSILIEKSDIPTLNVIKERLEKFEEIEKEKQEENKNIKKKSLFSIFKK